MLPGRVNDQLIMPLLLQLDLSLTDLVACNHCRIFLKALFVSDLASGDGLEFTDAAWNGEPPNYDVRADSWPKYSRPNRNSWKIWQQSLKKVILTRRRRLRNQLGAWLR
jgi:hypothetical protein